MEKTVVLPGSLIGLSALTAAQVISFSFLDPASFLIHAH